MRAEPTDSGAAWFAAMQAGDFVAAWRASDRVLTLRRPTEQDDPTLPYHLRWLWDGTPVEGRDVLVRCYHGLGDTLQFCRFLPALRTRAARVTLEVQAELVPLLTDAADRIVPFDPAAPYPLPPGGLALEIMELSHALRIAPTPIPYLPIPSSPIARRPAPGRRRVGLCWQVRTGWRPDRSMPEAMITALAMDGLVLHSLQPGQTPAGMLACPPVLADTARLIAGLDLVITIDTMVAHLAGAIGVPIWLLLDAAPDWRWLAGTGDDPRASPWYRGVRKYCQIEPGDWREPLRAVSRDLTRLVRAGTVEV